MAVPPYAGLGVGSRGVVHELLFRSAVVRFGTCDSFGREFGWLWHLPGEITTVVLEDSVARIRYRPLAGVQADRSGFDQAELRRFLLARACWSQAPVMDGRRVERS